MVQAGNLPELGRLLVNICKGNMHAGNNFFNGYTYLGIALKGIGKDTGKM